MEHIKSEKEFDKIIENDKVIIDFYAEWCGPCKMLSPILEKVSKEEKLTTYKVNVDDLEDVARRYGIMSIPTVIVFSKGHEHYSKKEYFMGPVLLKKKGKLFREYFQRELKAREILIQVLPKNYRFKKFLVKREIKMIQEEI